MPRRHSWWQTKVESTSEGTSKEAAEDSVVLQCIYWQGQGLSPKMAQWLYKLAIIPKIAYVDVAWWDRTDIALSRFALEHLQRTACIMIKGTMRTTPTKVLEVFLDLPTFGTTVESAVLMAAYRLPRPDPRNLGMTILSHRAIPAYVILGLSLVYWSTGSYWASVPSFANKCVARPQTI